MVVTRLKWNSLLRLSELEFIPEAPKILNVSDELQQAISWLTGTTGHDRRLLRCDENGALLTGDAWANLIEVETDELHPYTDTPDSFTTTVPNKGVLIATSTELVKITFVRVSGGASEDIYLPPENLYWFSHTVYSVTATVVPADSGTASYVGLTFYN